METEATITKEERTLTGKEATTLEETPPPFLNEDALFAIAESLVKEYQRREEVSFPTGLSLETTTKEIRDLLLKQQITPYDISDSRVEEAITDYLHRYASLAQFGKGIATLAEVQEANERYVRVQSLLHSPFTYRKNSLQTFFGWNGSLYLHDFLPRAQEILQVVAEHTETPEVALEIKLKTEGEIEVEEQGKKVKKKTVLERSFSDVEALNGYLAEQQLRNCHDYGAQILFQNDGLEGRISNLIKRPVLVNGEEQGPVSGAFWGLFVGLASVVAGLAESCETGCSGEFNNKWTEGFKACSYGRTWSNACELVKERCFRGVCSGTEGRGLEPLDLSPFYDTTGYNFLGIPLAIAIGLAIYAGQSIVYNHNLNRSYGVLVELHSAKKRYSAEEVLALEKVTGELKKIKI